MTLFCVCNRDPQEKSEHPDSKATLESWYKQRAVTNKKNVICAYAKIHMLHLSYRVFLVLRG